MSRREVYAIGHIPPADFEAHRKRLEKELANAELQMLRHPHCHSAETDYHRAVAALERFDRITADEIGPATGTPTPSALPQDRARVRRPAPEDNDTAA